MGNVNNVCLYIIKSHFGTYYTGITNNLIRRWSEHSSGKSRYLRKFKPKEVVYMIEFDNRRAAAQAEKRIKNIGANKFMMLQRLSKAHLK